MQVSKRGLGALAVLTAGLVLAQFVFGVPGSRSVRDARGTNADRAAILALADSATRLGIRVRTSQARRRVDSALAGSRRSAGSAILVLDSSAAAVAPLVDSQLATLGIPEHPRVPVRLALIEADTAGPRAAGMLRSFTLLPWSPAHDGCTAVLVVVRGGVVAEGFGGRGSRLPMGGAAAPCWYLATFGMPGPDIRRWLDSRYWDGASAIPPYASRSRLSGGSTSSSGLVGRILFPVLSPFLAQSALDAGCAGDKPELCEAALLAPLPADMLPEGIAGSEGLQRMLGGSPLWTPGLTADAKRSLLARMVDDLGADRFGEFWGSDAEVPDAFRSAAGESLGDWYRKQLRRELEEAGLPAPLEPPFWEISLGFLGLAIAASLWQAGRRQVR